MLGVILAGGKGTRLWPYSRRRLPKQFLNLGSLQTSLLQDTYQRLRQLVSNDNIYIVGSCEHEFELIRQMEQTAFMFPRSNLLLEPQGRNTAPAILWALFCLPPEKRHETLIISPADHFLMEDAQWSQSLQQGALLASEEKIVIFGLHPKHPETGYGYIKSGKPLSVGYEVAAFVEKPDKKTATEYLKSNQYTWNSGIFMATPSVLLKEYQQHTPKMWALFEQFFNSGRDLRESDLIETIYQQVQPDSFDYAILEKSQRVAMMPMDLTWSDLGSWESIHQTVPKDEKHNVIRGNVIVEDVQNCLIFGTKKLIAGVGLENLIIVETEDALLVCNLSRSQDVKLLVETLQAENRPEYQCFPTQSQHWGNRQLLSKTPTCQIHLVEIFPKQTYVVQTLQNQSLHWIVIQGRAEFGQGNQVVLLVKNESTYVAPSVNSQIRNCHHELLRFIVIQHENQSTEVS